MAELIAAALGLTAWEILKMAAAGLTVAAGTTAVGVYINNKAQKDSRWFDGLNNYYQFGVEFTSTIDQILIETGPHGPIHNLSRREIIGVDRFRPGLGVHTYKSSVPLAHDITSTPGYLLNSTHVTLEKKLDPDSKQIYYSVWISPNRWGAAALLELSRRVVQARTGMVNVYSIDTSQNEPKAFLRSKICHPARPHQQRLVDHIVREYRASRDNNVKLLISGPRGSGKTYVARLVKMALDAMPNTCCDLFDDFDPTAVGVSIDLLALSKAKAQTPVIVLIDEGDQAFRYVIADHQDFDPRLRHARNPTTFNQMLDKFGDTPYVIFIITTESSYETFYANEAYRSFIRHGRMDYRVAMTATSSTIIPIPPDSEPSSSSSSSSSSEEGIKFISKRVVPRSAKRTTCSPSLSHSSSIDDEEGVKYIPKKETEPVAKRTRSRSQN